MKKTYTSPAIETVSAQPSAMLTGSDTEDYTSTDSTWTLGNQNSEDDTQWDETGTIGEYTGDGSDIIVSAKPITVDNMWDGL